jgi:hypothetical protein
MCDITQPQMSPVNCWPWSHNWTKWEDINRGALSRNNIPVGLFLIQQRVCLNCNKKQLRTEKTLGEDL